MKHTPDDDCAKYLPEHQVQVLGESVAVADLKDGDEFTETVYRGKLWQADGIVHTGDDEIHVAITDVTPENAITISLAIENRYPGDIMIPTQVTDAVIPAPPRDDDPALSGWEYDHIRCFVGLSDRVNGDSWHDVTVTACSDPTLIGQSYDFGY